jgi:endonuclease/exonuclease/phosphatase (EEP) superfamily protein YafD
VHPTWRNAVRLLVVIALSALTVFELSTAGMHGVRAAPFALLVAGRGIVLLGLLAAVLAWFVWSVLRATKPEQLVAIILVGLLGATSVLDIASARPVNVGTVGRSMPGDLRLLSWNTNQDRTSVKSITNLVRKLHPDVIVLPEYFGAIAPRISASLPAGVYSRALSWNAAASSVWVSKALGSYKVVTTGVPSWAGFEIQPIDSIAAPSFVIAHLQHASIISAQLWDKHTDWVARACDGPNVIAVGDFNSTAQNLPRAGLGKCRDVSTTLGTTATGTWPTLLPAGVGAQIDRVLVGSDWRPVRFDVLGGEDQAGSDHRPIVVDLAPAN